MQTVRSWGETQAMGSMLLDWHAHAHDFCECLRPDLSSETCSSQQVLNSYIKPFSDMTCGWSPENRVPTLQQFAFHTCKTLREVLCTDAFTSATNPPYYSGKRWCKQIQQVEAGSNVLIQLQGSGDFVNSHTVVGSYHHKISKHLGWFLLRVWLSIIHAETFVLDFIFHFWVRSIKTPSLARCESSRGTPSVCSHWILLTLCWLNTRGKGEESPQIIWRLSLGH